MRVERRAGPRGVAAWAAASLAVSMLFIRRSLAKSAKLWSENWFRPCTGGSAWRLGEAVCEALEPRWCHGVLRD